MKEVGRGISTAVPFPITMEGLVLVRGKVLEGCLETGHQVNADLVRQCIGLLCDDFFLPALPSPWGRVHGHLQQLLVALSVGLHAGQSLLVVHLHTTHTPTAVQHTPQRTQG